MDKLVELAITSGPAVLLVAAGIFWGKNIIEYFFKQNVELKKQELKQEFEKFKLTITAEEQDYKHRLNLEFEKFKLTITAKEEDYKHKLNLELAKFNQTSQNETNFTLNKYQIESIKINRVLPNLEEFSENVKQMQVLFNSYINALENRVDYRSKENARVDIHVKMLAVSGKIDIYIPYELRKIINKMILIISNSFMDGRIFSEIYKQEISNKHRAVFLAECHQYLSHYRNAYYDIVGLYVQEFSILSKGDKRIEEILTSNKIEINEFNIIDEKIDVANIENLLLLNEYK